MKNVTRIVHNFEGKSLTTFIYDGEPYWRNHDLGKFLGYGNNGHNMWLSMRDSWLAPNKTPGRYYILVAGQLMQEFKAALNNDISKVLPSTSSKMTLLSKQGLLLVLERTGKTGIHHTKDFLLNKMLPSMTQIREGNEVGYLSMKKKRVVVEPANAKTPQVLPVEENTTCNALVPIQKEFEGHSITTLTYKGKPCWIAKEVGKVLGYALGGRRLVSKIHADWADEFIEGEDHLDLTGSELSEFKSLLEVDTKVVSTYSPKITLLFETGINMVMAKTSKPIGKRFRRFMISEVFTQISRDGAYLPDRKVENGQLVESTTPTPTPTSSTSPTLTAEAYQVLTEHEKKVTLRLTEERLLIKEKEEAARAEDDRRQARYEIVQMLVGDLQTSNYPDLKRIMTLQIVAAEIATGQALNMLQGLDAPIVVQEPLLPSPQKKTVHKVRAEWLPPTKIAKIFDVSDLCVGMAISALKIRGNHPGISRTTNKKHRTILGRYDGMCEYTPKGVGMIRQQLIDRGHIDS